MKNRITFLILLFGLFSTADAQSVVKSSNDLKNEGFNPVPGVVYSKVNTDVNYSERIAKIPTSVPANFTEPSFIKGGQWADYTSNPEVSEETRNYYTLAEAYFTALSPKVKLAFTVEELWYIYQFDTSLAIQLSTIN